MIINIRGTNGSGKSTLVRRIMDHYTTRDEVREELPNGKTKLVGYDLKRSASAPLFVAGPYRTACGGCDQLPTRDYIYDLIRRKANFGHVLFEGIMTGGEVKRTVALLENSSLRVIGLATSLDDCVAAVKERRLAKGNDKPLNPYNTEAKFGEVARALVRLREAGVTVEEMEREPAYQRVCCLLELPPK